ncbi:glycosyltransferase [Christiangramia echinicola]|uniref:Glycosyltransferase 2-like domain-containing protein n=1 Tax=Christiangramia echinicola TaxID=279359 RepID=A0A1H1L514_9FLAO|nr:glycosyltransferase [Christiangramia echinicola]SDR69115.1 hypothetical protein SAMN04488552_0534 [Christiangramia echinicola]
MNQPKLSIIISCYNDPFVKEAIMSAFNQTYPLKEIILVDDGSNSETKAIINSFKDKIDVLITQNNKGQSVARNNGIKKASGHYILNLDSDDFFENDFSQKAIDKFENDKAIKIVTCKAKRFNELGKIDIFTPRGGDIEKFLFANSAMGSSMFRRDDWSKSDGYEEELPILGFEDWEFYIQLLKNGGYAYVIDEVLFHYRIRENSTTARIKHIKQEKFKHIVLKHEELYKNNFESFVINLFQRINEEEFQKNRNLDRTEYRIGKVVLTPLRFIKRFFK